MTTIKLPKLPDRTPIKLPVTMTPDLHTKLEEYAKAYQDAYATQISITELIPAILGAFLESDRFFRKTKGST
ncbi:DUF2274 domain-containing protein [uncultured Novosphingobium sp.]|uniref:DUF2274 domain-containing protein n=1 Tax=uncultured Novosphingobium sp. TaxID=292277 RepID=UPI0025929903|nr:DUF2274 domain-containing protein [uncultured Novosphingobium sp.]